MEKRLLLAAVIFPGAWYVFESWHERYGAQQSSVTLGDDETRSIAFSFGAE